ncbi:MAG: dinitrogenase iron-molybdenum cofactor biosynthesis protein [Spirochaetes bacterium]|nr:MAG: dinitrogenase iron-molybdenum cofactor biosynthesis protein [Spirochaetota bacterium]
MKIVVTSEGETLDDSIDPRFGRAGKFILYNTETKEVQAVDNSESLNAAHGAGIKAAETVSRLGVEVVITGNCGPKALSALEAAGIVVYTGVTGTVRKAIEALESGRLSSGHSDEIEGSRR